MWEVIILPAVVGRVQETDLAICGQFYRSRAYYLIIDQHPRGVFIQHLKLFPWYSPQSNNIDTMRAGRGEGVICMPGNGFENLAIDFNNIIAD